MDKVLENIINYFKSPTPYISIGIIIVAFILFKACVKVVDKIVQKNDEKEEDTKRKITYIKLLNNIIKAIIIVFSLLAVLQINGINVTSILAGLGIVSVIAGLALQDALKDIIMGFNIITGNYFSIGDVIRVGTVDGKVLELGLKSTKIEDIANGNLLVIANRNIVDALTLSHQMYLDIPVPYETDSKSINDILNTAMNDLEKHEEIESATNLGVGKYGDSALYHKIRVDCLPENRPTVNRLVLQCIKTTFDENSITIPYQQIVIHNAKGKNN